MKSKDIFIYLPCLNVIIICVLKQRCSLEFDLQENTMVLIAKSSEWMRNF